MYNLVQSHTKKLDKLKLGDVPKNNFSILFKTIKIMKDKEGSQGNFRLLGTRKK